MLMCIPSGCLAPLACLSFAGADTLAAPAMIGPTCAGNCHQSQRTLPTKGMEGAWNEDAAVKAGQDALRRGATSEEAVAAIHAAGAESSGPKFFGASIGRILWEDTAASLIAESEVVGNRTARFGTSEERATLAEIAAEVSGLTRGERTWGRMARAVIS